MSEELRGLSLTQPWATLVAIGEKEIETRSWSTSYRGWIAVHAAKGFPREAIQQCFIPPYNLALKAAGYTKAGLLPLGAIIAVAHLEGIGRIGYEPETGAIRVAGYASSIFGRERAFGDYTPGRFGWVLKDVRRLRVPLPYKGRLSLWPVPADIAAEIWRRVEVAA